MESLHDFLKNNPDKGINDYYAQTSSNESSNPIPNNKSGFKNQTAMNKNRNYSALKFASKLLRIIGMVNIIIALTILILSILFLFIPFDSGSEIVNILSIFIKAEYGIGGVLLAMFYFVFSLVFYASSDFIKLIIDIEKNTRKG